MLINDCKAIKSSRLKDEGSVTQCYLVLDKAIIVSFKALICFDCSMRRQAQRFQRSFSAARSGSLSRDRGSAARVHESESTEARVSCQLLTTHNFPQTIAVFVCVVIFGTRHFQTLRVFMSCWNVSNNLIVHIYIGPLFYH